MSCHKQFDKPQALVAHTHHPAKSTGSRCLNCHMPRINEGLQDVVRTHTIFSPTHAGMIEANQPNACNLCHTEKSIEWTVGRLGEWYGAGFSAKALRENYPDPDGPVGVNWLKSEDSAVRLVAADALTRTHSEWALPELLEALDDPYLLNRQFARRGLERMLHVKLADYGYRFYMTPTERRGPIGRLREEFLKKERTETADRSTADER
jgi:hypothetical protein